MQKTVFFSLRNFKRDGGGSIRMYGLINALAARGEKVLFISNAEDTSGFHQNVEHIYIGKEATSLDKMLLQGMVALLPIKLLGLLYSGLFKKINNALKTISPATPIIFCEYLDNTIGYVLSKMGECHKPVHDLHGVATIEFDFQRQNSSSFKDKILLKLKYSLAKTLDGKVLGDAAAIIYASSQMRKYYETMFPRLKNKVYTTIPYLLSDSIGENTVNEKLKKDLLNKFEIHEDDFVFFFAGGFKPTSGIDDLIKAFLQLAKKHTEAKLIIIGDGPLKEVCTKLVENSELAGGKQIIFIKSIPYQDLFTYQSLANVIVCPDKQNPYSEMIVHLKYFDSLASGQLVINGSFGSVKEINPEEKLSLSFAPSNVESLNSVMKNAIENEQSLIKKYANTKKYTLQNLTYKNHVHKIETLIQTLSA